MSAEELAMYEQASLAEQEQALDASPDPHHDLHEVTESDAELDYFSSRGV